mgnify:CR=1 FL=1
MIISISLLPRMYVCCIQIEELVDMLIKKYHVSKSYKQEIMDALKQIRNGRENFSYPIKGTILSRYSEEQPGIVMHRETQRKR